MMSDTNPNDESLNQVEDSSGTESPVEPKTAEQQPQSAPNVGYCRICGRGLTEAETRRSGGVIYCAEHAPAPARGANYAAPPPDSDWAPTANPQVVDMSVSPGLAFVLGLIPGVGAIYNGQYAKGLIHVVVFGLLISILESGASGLTVLFALLLPVWVFYMAFEAFHTAKKRQAGEAVDEFSSLVPLKGKTSSSAGPIILIVLGAFFLLVTLDVIELYQVGRFWPALLILLGAWMLVSRRAAASGDQE